jgi:hypothetical protein
MATIGVEARINLVDQTVFVARVLARHDFDMAVSNFANLNDIN